MGDEKHSADATSHLEPGAPDGRESSPEIRKYFEELLRTINRARITICLYKEDHPLVAGMIQSISQELSNGFEGGNLHLEFQPGRIILNKKHLFGDSEVASLFSREMYRRRLSAITISKEMDSSSLYRFMRFIATDVEILQRQSHATGSFHPQDLKGITLEMVDFERLTHARGEVISTETATDKDRSVLSILFGIHGGDLYKGIPLTKYIPLSDDFVRIFRNVAGTMTSQTTQVLTSEGEKIPSVTGSVGSATGATSEQAAGQRIQELFRNMVEKASMADPHEAKPLMEELARHFSTFPPSMRNEILVTEIMEKGPEGALFALFAHIAPEKTEEIIGPMRRQARLEDKADLSFRVDQISEAIRRRAHEAEQKKTHVRSPAYVIAGTESLDAIAESFQPASLDGHYRGLLRQIFQETLNPDVLSNGLDVLLGEFRESVVLLEWEDARASLVSVLRSIEDKADAALAGALRKKVEKYALDILKTAYVRALTERDSKSTDRIRYLLGIFNADSHTLLIGALSTITDPEVRTAIIAALTGSGDVPEANLMNMLASEDANTVINAVDLVREIADPRFIPLLEHALKHPEENVRGRVLDTLSALKDLHSLRLLFRIWSEPGSSPSLRSRALYAMSGFDDPRVRELLLDILGDERNPSEDGLLRATGIRLLGKYSDDSEVIRRLLNHIKKPRFFHRKGWDDLKQAAVEALEQMRGIEARGALLQARKYILK